MTATRTSQSLDPFPDGWYVIALSDDIGVDRLIEKTWMGREIVAWRDAHGRVCVADAYCPHLGSYLGLGAGGEIRDGKLGDALKRPSFLASTPDFWRSMDMIGGAGTFDYNGGGTAKGNPFQQIGRTVGTPAARFREVNVFTYSRR